MDLRICTREEAGVTWDQLTSLLHDSFLERLNQGLRFTCSFMTAEQYAAKANSGTVLVAMDDANHALLGTVMLSLHVDKDGIAYGYHEHLAVSPSVKRAGIATRLLTACVTLTNAYGGKYLMSDTSIEAESSVKWHQKNGFKIYELESYRSTNYWSYVFVKPFEELARFSPVRIKLHFLKSYIFIRMARHIDGSDSWFGKIYKKISRK